MALAASCGGSSPEGARIDPKLSSVTVAPAQANADGVSPISITVTVRDQFGNPFPRALVAVVVVGTIACGGGAARPTDATGVAVFQCQSIVVGIGTVEAAALSPQNPNVTVQLVQRPRVTFITPVYPISGLVTGLTGGGLVLSSAGHPDLAVAAGASSFQFEVGSLPGTAYSVAVGAQPHGQTCRVLWGDGTIMGNYLLPPTLVECTGRWKTLAAGYGGSMGLTEDGLLWTWGNLGFVAPYIQPTQQQGWPLLVGTGYAGMAAGPLGRYALAADGSLWAWGSNEFGELGNGDTSNLPAPTRVGSGFVSIAASWDRAFALDAAGGLYGWGANDRGQLGDGTTQERHSPVLIGTGFSAVSGSDCHTVALKLDGSLWAWGANRGGEIGDGSTAERDSPVKVGDGFIAVAAGSTVLRDACFTLAIASGGSLYAFGANGFGQLGDGTTIDRHSPVTIGSGFVTIGAGEDYGIGTKGDGTTWAWGRGAYGVLGDGSWLDSHVPALVGSDFSLVAAGRRHVLAVKPDGALWAWGTDSLGELGDGRPGTESNAPTMTIPEPAP